MSKPELLLKTFIGPEDLNHLGTAFGGHLMGVLDMAGASLARREANSNVMLVAVNNIQFKAPFMPGDEVEVFGQVNKVGNTSIVTGLEGYAVNPVQNRRALALVGEYVFVAIDDQLQPRPIKR